MTRSRLELIQGVKLKGFFQSFILHWIKLTNLLFFILNDYGLSLMAAISLSEQVIRILKVLSDRIRFL